MKAPSASVHTLQQLLERNEGVDFEVKAAQGRDGCGAVPESIWATYSAFANTSGGLIVLGVEELAGKVLRVVGLREPDKVRNAFWTTLAEKVNRVLIGDSDVQPLRIDGKTVLAIRVPRAERSERPVYIGRDPLTGTYRRVHEIDQRCTEATVKAMLADALFEDRSAKVVDHYTLEDLDRETIERYRLRVSGSNPTGDLSHKPLPDFLHAIGAVQKDRETDTLVPKLSGLIMFGRHEAIIDRLPCFHLDYRRVENPGERYADRVIWDGSWSGNVFDFFLKVAPMLFESVPKSFALNEEMQRVDQAPLQVALREALVNALIHADYEIAGGIVIVRERSGFLFRNPGLMRVPINQALQGGVSDCRNRSLQQMFRLAGFAEQIGSGVSRIIAAWKGRSLQAPELTEHSPPDRTELLLHLAESLAPERSKISRGKSKIAVGKSKSPRGESKISAGKKSQISRGKSKISAGKKSQIPRGKSEEIIMQLCEEEPRTAAQLTEVLHRSQAYVGQLLRKLVREGKLESIHPPHHPRQSFRRIQER